MKKTITTLAIALAICGVAEAQNKQNRQNRQDNTNDFAVMYQMSVTQPIASYAKNSKELKDLDTFIKGCMNDREKSITSINITGYASPDGTAQTNTRISQERAEDMRQYLNKEYGVSNYSGTTEGICYSWAEAKRSIEKSSIPAKSRVLQIIASSKSEAAIEADLRAMPASWDYLCRSILPSMRSVEVKVTSREVRKPKAMQEACKPQQPVREEIVVYNNYYIISEQSSADDIIAFSPDIVPLDYESDRWKFKDRNHREKLKEERRGMYGRRETIFKYKK